MHVLQEPPGPNSGREAICAAHVWEGVGAFEETEWPEWPWGNEGTGLYPGSELIAECDALDLCDRDGT